MIKSVKKKKEICLKVSKAKRIKKLLFPYSS